MGSPGRARFYSIAGVLLVVSAGIVAGVGLTGGTSKPKDPCGLNACKATSSKIPTRAYEGAYVAADPTDPNHVVVTDMDLLGAKCDYHTTFDDGYTWTDGSFTLPAGFTGCRLNAPSGGGDHNGSVVIGTHGTIYATFSSATTTSAGRESILVATSDDGGKTFLPAVVAASPPAGYAYARPLMTVAKGSLGQDELLISFWGCHPQGGTLCDQANYISSDDGGQTFSPPLDVAIAPAGQNPSAPVMGARGVIYMTYQQRFSTQVVDLFVAKSTNNGVSFTSTMIDQENGLGLAYDAAKLALSPTTGELYAVWSDSRIGSSQIFFESSTNGGMTWSEAALLSPDETNFTGQSRSPSISVAPNGRIEVVYYYTPPLTPNDDTVYMDTSDDEGATFTYTEVSPAPINRSLGYSGPIGGLGEIGNFYPPTVSALDNASYVVWSDTMYATPLTQTQDVSFRTVYAAATAPTVPVRSPTASTTTTAPATTTTQPAAG